MLVCLFGHYSTQLMLLCAYWSSHSISSVCACWYFSELFLSQIILIVCLSVRVCVCCCVCDSPISCFSTYRFLNAIPQCSHSIISRTTHICGPPPNAQTHTTMHTLAFCSFLCTFSGSLCQTGGPLSVSFSLSLCVCALLSPPFFLYLSPFVSHMCPTKYVSPHTSKHIIQPELLPCNNGLGQTGELQRFIFLAWTSCICACKHYGYWVPWMSQFLLQEGVLSRTLAV